MEPFHLVLFHNEIKLIIQRHEEGINSDAKGVCFPIGNKGKTDTMWLSPSIESKGGVQSHHYLRDLANAHVFERSKLLDNLAKS